MASYVVGSRFIISNFEKLSPSALSWRNFTIMEQALSFEIESCDIFDKINFIFQDLQNVINNILKILEKIEQLLQTFKSVCLPQSQTAISFNRNHINESPNNPDIARNTIEKPTASGFHEIAGLKSIKAALHTLLILPRQQPQLFQNRSVSNSNSILLYGPPGTGKTKLVHGLAAESGASLHTISVSDLMSSFVGETEKKIKEIFSYLRTCGQFSILFIDEVDGLCRKRSSSENEYSRRIKTEFMCQMTKTEQNAGTFIIAATNCPWDLDAAILRRFQKRIYVPLPNSEERLELFQLLTKDIQIVNSPEELKKLIEISEGFSGSDISSLVQDALDIPLTELQGTTIWNQTVDGFYVPFTSKNQPTDIESICINDLKNLPPFSVQSRFVTVADFLEAAKHVQVTVKPKDLKKYDIFKSK